MNVCTLIHGCGRAHTLRPSLADRAAEPVRGKGKDKGRVSKPKA